MADTPAAQVLIGRILFVTLAVCIIFVQLLPLDTVPGNLAGPDFLVLITLTWSARRPDFAPVAVVAAVFLLADLLFQRPPGLWAALMVILTEMLRRRQDSIRNMPLMLEWVTVGVGLAAITLAHWVALRIVMSPVPSLGPSVSQLVMTILLYPLVALFAHVVFGVSRTAPGQVDSLGHRL